MKKKITFNILVIITIISLSVVLAGKTFQNDTFYTIKVGQSIFNNGIDMVEHFSWIGNLSYTYPHWLYDAFIYLIYNFFGFAGIYVSTILLTGLLLWTMYFTASKVIEDKGIAYCLVVLLSLTLSNFMAARAQLVSYTLLLFILYSIESLRKTNNKRCYIYIFISSLLIANMHSAVWPFIFVLFLPYLVNDLFYYLKCKYKNAISNYKKERHLHEGLIEIDKNENTKGTFISLGLVFLTGFLTPNFGTPFTYLIKTKLGITLSHISEHLPTTIDKRPIFFIILAIIIFLLLQSNMKIKLKDLLFIGGLSLLTLMSKRSYALFAILSLFSIARVVKLYLGKRLLTIKISDVLCNRVICLVLILIFGISTFLVAKSSLNKKYVNYSLYPTEASKYIIENLDLESIRLYNEYNFGSYLIFRDIPVFIDSRADLYTEEFNDGCEVFKEAMNLFKKYDSVFEKYQITHVIIYNTNKLNIVLNKDDNYKKIYKDSYFSIYEKLTY